MGRGLKDYQKTGDPHIHSGFFTKSTNAEIERLRNHKKWETGSLAVPGIYLMQ